VAETAPEPVKAESVKAEPAKAEAAKAAPVRRTPVRVVRQAPVRAKDKQETIAPPGTPAVAETKPEPPKPDPKVDCTPPYYFEGSKKIFKPACI